MTARNSPPQYRPLSGSAGASHSDNNKKNSDGTPIYYNANGRSPSTQPSSPGGTAGAGVREERDKMDLLYQTIQIDKQKCYVSGRITCGNEELYALESDISLSGYDGRCPKCRRAHVLFNEPNRGFYVSVKNIHDMINKEKSTIERSKGPKEIHQLPTVELKLPPLDQPIIGKNKGIEGNSNSCYMDATIFCMFAYNNVFDTLLYMNATTEPLQKLQQILRDNIVHVLREKPGGFVGRDALFHLRVQLSKATRDPSFEEVEKDPSEFLRALEELFKYAPLLTIPPDQPPKSDRSNITTNIMWEMFDANPSKLLSTNIAGIFRNSLSEIPAKLATIPPFLILVAPRHTRSQRSYRYIIPDRQITLDNNIVQLVCLKCKTTNHDPEKSRDFYFCDECYSKDPSSFTTSTTDATIACYCHSCLTQLHQNQTEELHNHKLKRIANDKHKLNLFAVLCIETCHYVAFVKCQDRSQQQHEWLFFDSMSDREYDEKNVALVDRVREFDRWIDEAEKDKDEFFNRLDQLRSDRRPTSQKFNENGMRQLRLFRDGAFFFYENSSVNYQ